MVTLSNLLKGVIEEAQGKDTYLMYAKKAKKEHLNIIAELFTDVANQEGEHENVLFELVQTIKKSEPTPRIKTPLITVFGTTE